MESLSAQSASWGRDVRSRARISMRMAPEAAVTLLAILLFALRLAAPENLLDQDQVRPATYVLDILKNGNWLCQRDLTGEITSKPPLYTWVCALICLPAGRVTLIGMYLPGAVAAWGTGMLVLWHGRKYLGTRAGFFAATALMLTTAGLKQFGLARTDSLFAFMVTAAALLAFRAWQDGRGWTWVWLVAAAATLTKGPLGVLLAAGGFWAVLWESKAQAPHPLRGSHYAGLAIFLTITAGWFWLAYRQEGAPFIHKLLGQEMVGQLSDQRRRIPGMLFYQPPLYYLSRAAPWSIFAIYGFWRVWKKPSNSDGARRFERFLFCWFCSGLILFCLSAHQRADLLWPIMPAGALLAGREIQRLSQRFNQVKFDYGFGVVVILGISLAAFYYFGPRTNDPIIPRTLALKALAREIEAQRQKDVPLMYVDAPAALQIYLNTWRPRISFEQAAENLRGEKTVYVAVNDLSKLQKARWPNDPPIYVLFSKHADLAAGGTRIIGNRPEQ